MFKEYIHDLYTEGLGDIFFMKYYHFLQKKIKNNYIRGILLGIHVFFYLLFLIIVGIVMFKLSFPL